MKTIPLTRGKIAVVDDADALPYPKNKGMIDDAVVDIPSRLLSSVTTDTVKHTSIRRSCLNLCLKRFSTEFDSLFGHAQKAPYASLVFGNALTPSGVVLSMPDERKE
jgi:hypothetical protein